MSSTCATVVCLLVILKPVLCDVITKDDPEFCDLCCRSKKQERNYRGYVCPGCPRCVLEDLGDSAESTRPPRRRHSSSGHSRNRTSASKLNLFATATTSWPTRLSRTRPRFRSSTTSTPVTTTPIQNCPPVIQVPNTCCEYVEHLPACFCRYCPGKTKRLIVL